MMKTAIRWCCGAAGAALLFLLYRVFFATPEDVIQGPVQKIIYIHVPSAMTMYLAFSVGLVAGLLFLWKRTPLFDQLSAASMEVGTLFCSAVLLTGPFWAKAAWNTWWTWDPRLTLTLFTWFIFVSYFALRRFFAESGKGPLWSAVFLLFGAVSVPLIHFSVRLWRGIHPVLKGDSAMPAEMRLTFYQGIATMMFVYVCFFLVAFRLRRREGASGGGDA
jgi:heme exporter protein C